MGTPANINVKVGDVYHSAIVNYDGYPDHVGELLFNFYNTQDVALMLVSKGDFSSLEENIADITYYNEEDGGVRISDVPEKDETYSYTWNGSAWYITGHDYDENDNLIEWNDEVLSRILGHDNPVTDLPKSEFDDSTEEKLLKYFGTSIDDVIAINEEWSVTYNTNDPRMTDSYNERQRWGVRHREAPYQGMDEDGIWHHTFFGRTLYEAVSKANEYLARGKEFEDGQRI